MKYIVLLVMLSGCLDNKCPMSDFVVDGLCVISEREVEQNKISDVIYIVEGEVNRKFGLLLGLPVFLDDIKSTLTFMEYVPDDVNQNYLGWKKRNNIYTLYFDDCYMQQSVIGHELLHLVDDFMLGGEVNHKNEHMFMKGADLYGMALSSTVEWMVERRVNNEVCIKGSDNEQESN